MATSKRIQIDGIPICITKKKMKNMYIRVDKATATVKVSVPNAVPFKEAEAFVLKNMAWVKSEYSKALEKSSSSPSEYTTGEHLLLWGIEYELEYIPSYCDKGIYIKNDKAILYAPLDSTASDRQAIVDKWYREELQSKIDSLVDECCEIAGTSPYEWRIKDMKTKWGTCNYVDRRIWISLQIARKSEICLKYVMLHELTHLYVPNHGPEFKAYLDDFMPDWRKVKKLLNS